MAENSFEQTKLSSTEYSSWAIFKCKQNAIIAVVVDKHTEQNTISKLESTTGNQSCRASYTSNCCFRFLSTTAIAIITFQLLTYNKRLLTLFANADQPSFGATGKVGGHWPFSPPLNYQWLQYTHRLIPDDIHHEDRSFLRRQLSQQNHEREGGTKNLRSIMSTHE